MMAKLKKDRAGGVERGECSEVWKGSVWLGDRSLNLKGL